MATSVGYATLQVIPSAKGFGAALESQVAPGMSGAGASAGKSFGNSFKSIAGPLAAAASAAAIGGFAKSAISAASGLNETISKTGQIFGGSSGAILEWSKNSATALGQSRQQALDAASTFAIVGKGAGLSGEDLTGFSTKLVGLSADFSSFFDSSPEEAITAIGAALRGESEPIRRFGVLMNDSVLKQEALKMGLIKTTSEALTPQAKALASYQVIMNQTKDAQGDFQRTADGVANSSRSVSARFTDLKAVIGASLLPVVKQLLNFAGLLIQGFLAIPGPVKIFIATFGGLIATFILVKKAILATKAAMLLLNTAMKANVVLLIVSAVIALGVAMVAAYKKSETFRKIVNDVFRAVAKIVGTVIGYVIGLISSMVKAWTLGMKSVLTLLSKLPKVGGFAKKALAGIDSLTGGLDSLAKNAKGMVTGLTAGLKDEIPKAATDGGKAAADALKLAGGEFNLAGADLGAAAAAGAASGVAKTKAQLTKDLTKGIGSAFIKAVQGTSEQVKSAFEKLAEDVKATGSKKLISAVADTQKKILALVGKRDVLRDVYSEAKSSLADLKKEAADYVKTVADSVVATGNISESKSFSSIVRNLTESVSVAKQFSSVIASLKSSGLNNTALGQLVSAGPEASLKAAQSLLASGSVGIETINSLQAELAAQGEAIGSTISGSIYDAAIADGEKVVKAIGDELTTIENQIVSVAAAFAKELAKIGKIPAPAWLKDLTAATKYTVKAPVAPKSPVTTSAKTGTATSKTGSTVTVNNYNPVAEPSSVTTSKTLTKLAILGIG